ncbi:ThuA domain-containing protein [Granulosicoccus sp. 3-233]|uniref:ThuA domain-containing protein n=1 Tax=Granulosicoccus sp. 3-233 TaxID=3417969 RepID=UPI003D3391C4
MKPVKGNCLPVRRAVILLLCTLLLSACSGSGNSPQSGADTAGAPGTGLDAGDADGTGTAGDTGQMSDEPGADTTGGHVDATADDTGSGSEAGMGDGTPDPLAGNTVTVRFDITVPSRVSDALQLEVVWGDETLVASWVGDEYWTATADFPAATENRLIVTFYDDNGGIVLGRLEQDYRTGSNESEVLVILADQFDTALWDDDNDGSSNLEELIAGTSPTGSARVLLFSETRGYRHESIEAALQALEELSASSDILTVRAEDSAEVFTEGNLAGFDAVIWVLTSGDVLDADEQEAFENYIRSGGGYAGIHAASDTEYEWPWYGSLVGAYFERHPEIQTATQDVEDGSHPSTTHLGSRWTRTDEWYDYRANPRAQVTVLLSLDEDSYTGGGMGGDHPSAWYHAYDGGRSWYTGGGHTESSYAEPEFRAHLLGGLRYAAGLAD